MSIISKLWVNLGLKDDDFSKGLNKASANTKSFANTAGKAVGEFATKFLSVSAVVAGVGKVIKDSIALTQKWGDQWAITVDGVKSAYGVFIRQLSSGEGWDNLFSNMAHAYAQGKEIAAALDEIFERKVSYAYAEAEGKKFISEQQLIMRDSSRSDAERMAAAKAIIAKEEEIGEIKKQVWTDEAKAYRDRFQLQTGLNDEQTDFLLKNYNANREIINQAVAYTEAKNKAEADLRNAKGSYGTGTMSDAAYAAIQNKINTAKASLSSLEANTSQAIKDIAAIVMLYNRSNDELVQNMSDAEIAVINIDTEINQASMRATSTLGTLTSKVKELSNTSVEAAASMKVAFEAITGPDLKGLATADIGGLAGQTEYWAKVMEEAAISSDNLHESLYRMQALANETARAAVYGLSDAIQEFADQLFGLSEMNAGSIIAALLSPLAELAKREGEILILQGLGIEAVKTSLATLNGIAAIAAGTALLAIGSGVSAALSSLANRGGGGSATTSTSSSSYAGSSGTTTSELVVRVEGTIKGSDIIISGQKTESAWAR